MQKKNFLILLVLSLFSLAAKSNTQSKTSTKSKASKILKNLSGVALTSMESNQYDSGDSGDVTNLSFTGLLTYKLNNSESITTMVPFTKSLNGIGEETVDDGFLRYTKSHDMNSNLKVLNNYRVILPLSEDSINNSSLITALTWSPTFVMKLKKPQNLKNLSLMVKPFIRKNFHTYTTSLAGELNPEWRGTLWLELDAGITKKVSYSIGTIGVSQISYNGNNLSDTFRFYNQISYQYSAISSFQLGLTNKGSMLSASGQRDNLSFYNEDTSMIYTQSTLIF